MGWHINYEIEFEDWVDFDREDMEEKLKDDDIVHDVEVMLLRGFKCPRCIACVYSHTKISEVLDILLRVYKTPMKYRLYDEEVDWKIYTSHKTEEE